MKNLSVFRPLALALILAVFAPIEAQSAAAQDEVARDKALRGEEPTRLRSPNNPLIPLREIQNRRRHIERGINPDAAVFPNEFRTIDGVGNNGANPAWGSAGIPFLRLTTVGYGDGSSTPGGAGLPGAREVSNAIATQTADTPNAGGFSDLVWQWGQFLDHDLDLTPEADPEEHMDIPVPMGDAWFDPGNTGTMTIPLNRSVWQDVGGVRQQLNTITAFIDGSNVYGSDQVRADALRTFAGDGRLETSAGDLLPFNVDGLPNADVGDDRAAFFLAGDFRANEQVGLTSMHTLFVREHNYWADLLAVTLPELSGEEIYQYARAIVVAELQAITYREFLPILLGPDALPPYAGYQTGVDAGIANVFASAAYRFGHSMLSPRLQRLDAEGLEIPEGHLSLADAFFSPDVLIATGIDPILRGLATQQAQEVDNLVVDEVRNFLFGPPGAGGFDLASLNIQRGREHGMPSFNQIRRDYGLAPYTAFEQIHSDPVVTGRLAAVYPTVEDIDAWVGGLAEEHVPGALLGETWRAVMIDQFTRLRDGDRFWYQSYLPDFMVEKIDSQPFAQIIRRNTGIFREIDDDVFRIDAPAESVTKRRPDAFVDRR